jgi:hypothetical protein
MAHCECVVLLCPSAVMTVLVYCAEQTVKKVDAAGMAAACETAAVAGLKGQTLYASQGEAYQTPLQVST